LSRAVQGAACAAAVVAAVTLLIYPLQDLDPGVSSGVLYVLGVLLVATYWGLWLGLATSAASAVARHHRRRRDPGAGRGSAAYLNRAASCG